MKDENNTQGITIKVKLIIEDKADEAKFSRTMEQFRQACNFVSQYIFENGFVLNQFKVREVLYRHIRESFGLKSQMADSAIRCTIARYKTVKEQMRQNPYRIWDESTKKQYTFSRDLSWLQKPIHFRRPQVDLARNRDWSKRADGTLSINTLDGRVIAKPICRGFDQYFDGKWKFGGAKLLRGKGCWMLHIGATKEIETFDASRPKHIVGIDRGLRFLAVTHDENGKCQFFSGKEIQRKRDAFARTRQRLQRKGTWSAKRALRRIEHRENRWMTDVNHQLSKTLVQTYGAGTLFVIEDLAGVSFEDSNLARRTRNGRRQLRSWAFYQLEMFLNYKARLADSEVLKVSAKYTSQRCPKCGAIHKENRKHSRHEYVCDCGYRANDDLTAARNIYHLGELYVQGVEKPRFEKLKTVA